MEKIFPEWNMFRFFFSFIILIILSVISCTPEDGFCIEEKHSGGDDFSCSQLDDHFSATGSGIEEYYTSRKALYDGSFVSSGGSDTVIIDKPDYIPEVIIMEKMTSCTIAPKVGGVDCKSWYSFDFTTTDGDSITISSRDGDDFNKNLALYYLTFESRGIEFSGFINSSKMGINDFAVIGSGTAQVVHRYTFVEK